MTKLNEQLKTNKKKEWWEKPGLGIMYQIEARPGWIWERDFDKFNASMTGENGKFNFNGPFCKIKEWVEFSKTVGVDYHIFEAKWHDGICYFNTKFTEWKTPVDYCKTFAVESKKAKIPFMFYYSSIFDHNPQFDDIQPIRNFTPSYIALHRDKKEEVITFSLKFTQMLVNLFLKNLMRGINKNKKGKEKKEIQFIGQLSKYSPDNFHRLLENVDDISAHFTYNPEKYEKYLYNQLAELIQNYKTDGLWMDWFMKSSIREGSTELIMNVMKKEYPNVVLAFNNSVNERVRYCHYLSGEAHTVESAWKQGNKFRRKKIPWELVGPAAKSWFDTSPRIDPYEIGRITVIIMANGGKYCLGLPSRMDGMLHPKPAQHVEMLGIWYKTRQLLFKDAISMDYKGDKVPGIKISEKQFGTIGSIYDNDNLIHLVNFKGSEKDLTLTFSQDHWGNIEKIVLEPNKKELKYIKQNNKIILTLQKEDIDKADTIIRIC